MFEYAIYDVTTGDCLETFIVEQDLGEEPEVGDIWEIYDPNAGTYKAMVINTSDFVHPYCVTDDFHGAFLWGYTTETYIGKSKANINDLFEVSDD